MPERLAAQLPAGVPAAIPLALPHRCVGSRHVAKEAEHQGHRVLRGGDGVAGRGVDDHHAGARRRLDVDPIDPDARDADDAQSRARLRQAARASTRVCERTTSASQPPSSARSVEQSARRQPEADLGVVRGGESVEPGLGHGLDDEDAGHGGPSLRAHYSFAGTSGWLSSGMMMMQPKMLFGSPAPLNGMNCGGDRGIEHVGGLSEARDREFDALAPTTDLEAARRAAFLLVGVDGARARVLGVDVHAAARDDDVANFQLAMGGVEAVRRFLVVDLAAVNSSHPGPGAVMFVVNDPDVTVAVRQV